MTSINNRFACEVRTSVKVGLGYVIATSEKDARQAIINHLHPSETSNFSIIVRKWDSLKNLEPFFFDRPLV